MAAQVLTYQGVKQINHRLFRLKVYCRCDTTKATWDDAVIVADDDVIRIQGRILCVDTVPGPEAAPTADYDLTLENEEGIDVMGGGLADRSHTAEERGWPLATVGQTTYIVEPPVEGPLTVTMANNSVNGADWTMYIYYLSIVDEGLG